MEAFESASEGIQGELNVSFVEQMADESDFVVGDIVDIGFEAKEFLEAFDLTTHCMEETVPVLVINLLGIETACGLRRDKYGTVFLGKELLGLSEDDKAFDGQELLEALSLTSSNCTRAILSGFWDEDDTTFDGREPLHVSDPIFVW